MWSLPDPGMGGSSTNREAVTGVVDGWVVTPYNMTQLFNEEIRRLRDEVYGGQDVPRAVWETVYDRYARAAGVRTIDEVKADTQGGTPGFFEGFGADFTQEQAKVVQAVTGGAAAVGNVAGSALTTTAQTVGGVVAGIASPVLRATIVPLVILTVIAFAALAIVREVKA